MTRDPVCLPRWTPPEPDGAEAGELLGWTVARLHRGRGADLTHASLYETREDAEREVRAWGGSRYVAAEVRVPP